MTHLTMNDECGAHMQRALLIGTAWWASFITALVLAWSYWPEAREALAFGLTWFGIGGA